MEENQEYVGLHTGGRRDRVAGGTLGKEPASLPVLQAALPIVCFTVTDPAHIASFGGGMSRQMRLYQCCLRHVPANLNGEVHIEGKTVKTRLADATLVAGTGLKELSRTARLQCADC